MRHPVRPTKTAGWLFNMLIGAGDLKHDRLVSFYVFANQYHLIRPAEVALEGGWGHKTSGGSKSSASLADHMKARIERAVRKGVNQKLVQAMRNGRFQVKLVAFSDPEDLLAHPFVGAASNGDPDQSNHVGTVSVIVRNPNLIFGFLLASPLNAHLGLQGQPGASFSNTQRSGKGQNRECTT